MLAVLIGLIADVAFGILPNISQPDQPMSGEFNVAIAEFSVVDGQGEQVRTSDGRQLADFLYGRLEISFGDFDLPIPYELLPPEKTGLILGSTREERAAAAAELASQRNANVVIYGVVHHENDHSRLEPEFYIDYRGFEQAQEVVGPHAFGQPIQIELPFRARQFQGEANPPLNARTQALSLLTLGLAYHSTGNLQSALDYYEAAESVQGLSRRDGKEVLLLLLGNVHATLASQTRCDLTLTEEHRLTGTTYYDQALDIDPNYGRAMLGEAGILYLQAFNDPSSPRIDHTLLDQAVAQFEKAANTNNQPASANIQPKANFGLGQIELVRQIEKGEPVDKVATRFLAVINEYEAGNSALEELAGHAYARLGLIRRLEGQSNVAALNYERAIEILTNYSAYFKTDYRIRLGKVYLELEETELAESLCVAARDSALDLQEPQLEGLALSCLAEHAHRAGELQQAEQFYTEAIQATAEQCSQDAASYYVDLARLYGANQRRDDALASYLAAIALAYTPELQAHYYTLLGDFYAESEEYQEAVSAYDEAIHIVRINGDQQLEAIYTEKRDLFLSSQ